MIKKKGQVSRKITFFKCPDVKKSSEIIVCLLGVKNNPPTTIITTNTMACQNYGQVRICCFYLYIYVNVLFIVFRERDTHTQI